MLLKKCSMAFLLSLICFVYLIIPGIQPTAQAKQAETTDESIRVFLDRFNRNEEFIRQEIPNINYVRDPRQAQVYILLTEQGTGGGGREYTLTFTGQENFSGITDTLKYVAAQSDTDEIRRQGIARFLRIGLVRYLSRTSMAGDITVNLPGRSERQEQQPVDDKWNYWFFRINADTNFEEEESSKEISIGGSISANRITEDWKIDLRFRPDYSEDIYKTSDETYTSISRQNEFNGLVVKSLSDHWSAGAVSKIFSETRVNTDLSIAVGPAVEYNIFPYSMSTRRQFTFRLGLWGQKIDYDTETIFDKDSENLFYSTLSVGTQIIERWGNIRSTIEGSIYTHDAEVNKLEWDTNFDIRITRGLSFDLGFQASLIHDQLYIAKGDRSIDEILLRRTQLKTDWSYDVRAGISYTFGSQYNNIVNPRFGSNRRGGGDHR
ncbi:hypothetical protein ACFL7D_01725 [candidate division KSB1 bacterium]